MSAVVHALFIVVVGQCVFAAFVAGSIARCEWRRACARRARIDWDVVGGRR